MVQNDSSNSGDESAPAFINPAKGIESGNYCLIGWSIDTTGRRLIDEICQIAAYTPKSQFSQYIMPHADLNPIFSQKHNIRIINTVRFRRLKDMKTNQYVKTKSELSALQDFLQWLEEAKGDSDGVILVYHEFRKASPGMLLEALRRRNMLEQFNNLVKGFANSFNIAQAKCANTTKSFSLRVMSKVLLNKEDEVYSSAVDRARASYQIAEHLAQSERQELEGKGDGDNTDMMPLLINLVCPYTNSISAEEEEITAFKLLLEVQNTYRPVFGALLKASRIERQKASHLRRLLAMNNISYDKSKEAYEKDAKEGLEKLIKNEIANAKENEIQDLLEILDCYFDPDKKPIQPKARPTYNNNNNRGPRRRSFNKPKTSISESSPENPETSPGTNQEEVSASTVEIKTEPVEAH